MMKPLNITTVSLKHQNAVYYYTGYKFNATKRQKNKII